MRTWDQIRRYPRAYLRNRLHVANARAHLMAHGTLAAAEAMWRLNRAAKRSWVRGQVYALKTLFIRELYRRFGAVVTRQLQVQRCWGTWRHGCDADCPKCGGTGIYSEHELLLFEFEIAGRKYYWHQPASVVDWPVQVTGDVGDYRNERPRESEPIEIEADLDELLAIVREWLLAMEVELEPGHFPVAYTLPETVRLTLRDIRSELRYHLWWLPRAHVVDAYWAAKRWWGMRRRGASAQPAYAIAEDDEDLAF